MTTATAPKIALEADVLEAVARSKHPRIDLPTIAANRGLSLDQVKIIANRYGYPDPARMRQHAQRLRGLAADGADQDDQPDPATAEAPTAAPVAGPKRDPFITAIPTSALFADPAYQRPLDQLRVQRMANNYDVALVGILEVAARADGKYAILDGQHRWACVRDVTFGTTGENPHIPCRVHTGLTVAEEAELYHRLNTTRKQLTGWDRWWARRGAGDPDVLAIEKVAGEHGYSIGSNVGPNILRATRACENVVALGGLGLLGEVLSTIRTAYGDDQASLDAAIIYGLGHILHVYTRDELDLPRLIEALTSIVPRQLTARAAAMREVHKGTMDRLTATVIVDRYNTTKGPKLPAFADRVKPHHKTPTSAKGAEARERAAILEWAKRTGWPGRHDRCSKAMREAYAAAHDEQAEQAS